jgi:hypothetical protein
VSCQTQHRLWHALSCGYVDKHTQRQAERLHGQMRAIEANAGSFAIGGRQSCFDVTISGTSYLGDRIENSPVEPLNTHRADRHPVIMPLMLLLGLNPSIPSWINAATVVVLAIITWHYAKSAKRQADAAEAQAKAATKQAEAAERQLTVLQSQIQEQAGMALATLKENVAELGRTANHWFQQMILWGQLTPHTGVDLLPSGWAVSLEHARRISPDLYQELLALQRLSKKVALMIDQFTAKPGDCRNDTEANQIKELLMQIVKGCEAASRKTV